MYRSFLASGFFLAVVCLFGCKSTPPASPVANVKGTVSLDGKPLPAGEIHFGTTGVPAKILDIKDGAFAGEVLVGDNKVEVFIYVEGPPSEKYGGTRPKINTTLPKYWGPTTTLSATVGAGEANEFKFDLTSK